MPKEQVENKVQEEFRRKKSLETEVTLRSSQRDRNRAKS